MIVPTDGELLLRHRQAEGDQGAMEQLLERHAAMVWGVCRGVLHREQDAEDAFQATFLILVRQAKSIRATESAAGWLYRVALRTALAARRTRLRRREESLSEEPAAPEVAFPPLHIRHARLVLMEELRGLPDKYQTPLVMRYLEGQSRQTIADQTDTTVAAVQGQLARGKRMLRMRLARRGVSLSLAMGLVAGAESADAASISLPSTAFLTSGGSLASPAPVVQLLVSQGIRSMFIAAYAKPLAAVSFVALAAMLAVAADQPINPTPPVAALQLQVDPLPEAQEQEAPAPKVEVAKKKADAQEPTNSSGYTAAPELSLYQPPPKWPRQQIPNNAGWPASTARTAILPVPNNESQAADRKLHKQQLEIEINYWQLKMEGLTEKAKARSEHLNAVKETKTMTGAEMAEARAEIALISAEALLAKAKGIETERRLAKLNAPQPTQVPTPTRATLPPSDGAARYQLYSNNQPIGREVYPPTPAPRTVYEERAPGEMVPRAVPADPRPQARYDPPSVPIPAPELYSSNTLKPFDTIMVRVGNVKPDQPINDAYSIQPSGKIDLGPTYGKVLVAGMTLEQAEQAIEKTLSKKYKQVLVRVTRPPAPEPDWTPAPREQGFEQAPVLFQKQDSHPTTELVFSPGDEVVATVRQLVNEHVEGAMARPVFESRVARVDRDGSISFNGFGPYKIVGLTPAEALKAIQAWSPLVVAIRRLETNEPVPIQPLTQPSNRDASYFQAPDAPQLRYAPPTASPTIQPGDRLHLEIVEFPSGDPLVDNRSGFEQRSLIPSDLVVEAEGTLALGAVGQSGGGGQVAVGGGKDCPRQGPGGPLQGRRWQRRHETERVPRAGDPVCRAQPARRRGVLMEGSVARLSSESWGVRLRDSSGAGGY